MKKIIVFICLIIMAFMITGCQKTGSGASKENKRPKAEGESYSVRYLEFFLPKELKKNYAKEREEIYEFYTGELKSTGPTGIDVVISTSKVDEKFKLKDYANKDSVAAKKKIRLEKKTINGSDWYFGERDTAYYYCGYYEGYVYNVEIKQNSDPDDVYADLLKMFEETMYFDILEEK